ncbi:MD-2-related lipid-recognition domain [Trinorchestia longiramus]|nr:MD-2-related lipid-recognition domain [Trinorchestia longiramus]
MCPLIFATEFLDCGSEALSVSLDVASCDIPPCVVSRGDTFSVSIIFDTDHEVETLIADVTANIGGLSVPWPGFDEDACAYTEPSCPIGVNVVANWTYPVEILPEYPAITTVATFRLLDGDLHDEVCLQVPVTII